MTLIFLNFLICSVGGYISICRMSQMNKGDTKLTVRWQYVIWFTMFGASGFSFAFGEPPSITQIGMSACVLSHIALGYGAWKHGLPKYARRIRVGDDTTIFERRSF